MSGLVMLGTAAGGIVAFGLFAAALARWPALVLIVASCLAVINWEVPVSPLLVNVAGISIYPEDAITAAVLAITIARPSRLVRVLTGLRPSFIVLLIILTGSLVAGYATFGSAAVTEFREFAYSIGITVWAVNQDWGSPQWVRRLRLWAKVTGVILVLVLLFHAAMYGLGAADTFVTSWTTGELRTNRPLVSSQALLLTCFGFVLFGQNRATKSSDVFFGSIFLIAAVLCQHRSVWLAIGIAVVTVAVHLRGVALARLVVGSVVLLLTGSLLVLSGVVKPLVDSLLYSITSSGTLENRELSWLILVQQNIDLGIWTVLFGQPFGTGYFRVLDGLEVYYGPHNWYVSIFLRTGVVGLAVFVIALVTTLVKLVRRRDLVAVAIVAAIATYCWTYAIAWYACILLGWAIVRAAHPRPPANTSLVTESFFASR